MLVTRPGPGLDNIEVVAFVDGDFGVLLDNLIYRFLENCHRPAFRGDSSRSRDRGGRMRLRLSVVAGRRCERVYAGGTWNSYNGICLKIHRESILKSHRSGNTITKIH
jgi:hypothetical protein